MTTRVELGWPTTWTDELGQQAYALIHAVTEVGGAIGWHRPPPKEESDQWLRGVLDAVVAGDAALCTASIDDRIVAMGMWQRDEDAEYFRHTAWFRKIMAHPQTRGLGLGERVSRAVIESCRAAGIETLQLGVRGNNHLAIELYEALGFTVWGRLPNVLEVGDDRIDDVRMSLVLGRPAHLALHGSGATGPGTSPARSQRQGLA